MNDVVIGKFPVALRAVALRSFLYSSSCRLFRFYYIERMPYFKDKGHSNKQWRIIFIVFGTLFHLDFVIKVKMMYGWSSSDVNCTRRKTISYNF